MDVHHQVMQLAFLLEIQLRQVRDEPGEKLATADQEFRDNQERALITKHLQPQLLPCHCFPDLYILAPGRE